MYRKSLKFLAFICFIPCAFATEPLKVVEYLTDPIEVLDAQANFISHKTQAELPKPGVVVTQVNEDLDLVQITLADGSVIWIDKFNLKLNQEKAVKLPCTELMTSTFKESSDGTHGTMGFGQKCKRD
jgi:hypothetical protein